jgi:ubiquinol-cytochrome c reductase cytochrome b subunit
MFPVFMAKTGGFMFVVSGAIALLGAFAQINPIWQFGPYTASRISYAVQPDWYMGFLDGALRIFPAWSFHSFGYTIPFEVTIPAVIFPGILFNAVLAWPAIERHFTKDNEMHNLLDRPSNRPKRTAAGVTVAVLLSMLFIASSTDVIANFLHLSLNTVLWAMRILCIVTPFIAYPLTYKICREMQAFAGAGKRKTTNVVTRTVEGEYVATPAPVYVDDEHDELEAMPVPVFVHEPEDVVAAEGGVRRIAR